MQFVFQAVVPVFGLIWMGYFFKRINMPGDDFWPLAERITYYVFLPSLFFISILKADFTALDHVIPLVSVVVLGMLLTSAVTFATQYSWLKLDGKRFASFYQGGIRFNNYIGIPIVFSLYGHEGLVIYAIIIGMTIPLSNILSVAVMSHFASDHAFSVKRLAKSLYSNPLIIGPVAGLIANMLHVKLFYLEDMLKFFADAATSLGLLTVGASIDFAAIHASRRSLSVVSVIKLIINPVVIGILCWLLGISAMQANVAIVYAALPVAASSYLLAKQFGANAPLTVSIVVVTTLGAMATLPVLLVILHSMPS